MNEMENKSMKEYRIRMLGHYSSEEKVSERSIYDLSPLERWLFNRLYDKTEECEQINYGGVVKEKTAIAGVKEYFIVVNIMKGWTYKITRVRKTDDQVDKNNQVVEFTWDLKDRYEFCDYSGAEKMIQWLLTYPGLEDDRFAIFKEFKKA